MEGNSNPQNLPARTLSVEAQKLNINIHLLKKQLLVQKLLNELDELVLNDEPENLYKIQKVLDTAEMYLGQVDDTAQLVKEPHYSNYKNTLQAGKELSAEVLEKSAPIYERFQEILKRISIQKSEQVKDQEAKTGLSYLVETSLLSFAFEISNCLSSKELVEIEKRLALEKTDSRKSKYGEFFDKAKQRLDEILVPLIKKQKNYIDSKEKLIKKANKAKTPEELEGINAEINTIDENIEQLKVEVQQMALNQDSLFTIDTTILYPEADVSRSSVTSEIHDLEKALKSSRSLLKIELKKKEANSIGIKLRDEGKFGDKEEFIQDGIKFILKRKYRYYGNEETSNPTPVSEEA